MESLYPDGNALRVNHELSVAISKALVYLGFYEMPEADQPKYNIWGHPELLDEWFEQVKARRANPGMEKVPDEWAEFDGEQNELTKDYRK